MACLRHAITPKYYLKSQYPFVKHEWGAYGLPETIMVDRGPEFQNRSLDPSITLAAPGVQRRDCDWQT